MSLAEYEILRAPVKIRGKEVFSVRGLDLDDITFLAENYLKDIMQAVARFGRDKRDLGKVDYTTLLITISKDFPSLSAEIISRAADEPGQTEKARKLPWAVQLMALKEIIRLSAEEAGGLKNLGAVLAAALEMDQQTARLVDDLAARLRTIIGDSGKTSASFLQTDTALQTDTPSPE